MRINLKLKSCDSDIAICRFVDSALSYQSVHHIGVQNIQIQISNLCTALGSDQNIESRAKQPSFQNPINRTFTR